MVAMAGLEPATPSSRTTCATKLRHNPVITDFLVLVRNSAENHFSL